MKKNISKFKGITYPLFALRLKPYSISYDLEKIYVQKTSEGHAQTADDKKFSGDYFSRLLQIEHRLHFEYTCRNLQDIVFNKVKWGIDASGTPFDLTRKEKVQTKIVTVDRVKDNLIWFRTISYPFKLPTLENFELTDKLYAVLVHIENEWFIKEFCIDKPHISKEVFI